MAPAGAAVPGLQTQFPACTWGRDSLVSSALACAQPQCGRGWGSSSTCLPYGLTWRLAMDADGSRGGTTGPSLCCHSHLLLLAQAVSPDAILSIKWTLAGFSEAPFSFVTRGAHSPIQCVSSCVFCLNTILPSPFRQC